MSNLFEEFPELTAHCEQFFGAIADLLKTDLSKKECEQIHSALLKIIHAETYEEISNALSALKSTQCDPTALLTCLTKTLKKNSLDKDNSFIIAYLMNIQLLEQLINKQVPEVEELLEPVNKFYQNNKNLIVKHGNKCSSIGFITSGIVGSIASISYLLASRSEETFGYVIGVQIALLYIIISGIQQYPAKIELPPPPTPNPSKTETKTAHHTEEKKPVGQAKNPCSLWRVVSLPVTIGVSILSTGASCVANSCCCFFNKKEQPKKPKILMSRTGKPLSTNQLRYRPGG